MYRVKAIERSLDEGGGHATDDTVTATLHFLPRDPLFNEEKPYSIQYTPHGDIPQTNVYQDIVKGVKVRNIRSIRDKFHFNDDGIIMRNFKTQMSYEDFAVPEIVRSVYVPEITQLLRQEMGVHNVAILEYLVRRRHASFPLSTGKEFDFAQPVATAHIDFSPDCIQEILVDRYQDRADELMRHRYQVVNVWKPLIGPLRDWPLALCHPRSVMPEKDLQLMDRVYAANIEESIQIHYSSDQEWLYLEEQTPEEVLVFRGGDSDLGMRGGVPHCSFKLGDTVEATQPRESVEIRAFISYCPYDLEMERVVPSRRHGPKSSFQNVAPGNGAAEISEKSHMLSEGMAAH